MLKRRLTTNKKPPCRWPVLTRPQVAGFQVAIGAKDQQVHYVPGNSSSVADVVDGLSSKLDDDDLLVIYTTGHGDQGNGAGGCVQLQDSCLPLDDLRNKVDKITYGKRVVVMDQCFPGNGLRLFGNTNTTVVTQGSQNEEVSCQQFSPYFWEKDIPEAAADGVVTLRERYEHALNKGKTSTHTGFFELGAATAFSGKAEKAPFSNTVLHVDSDAELEQKLGELHPGQTAVVAFSADWCEPCKKYEPQFEKLAKDYDGQYLMLTLKGRNGSEKEWADKFGIAQFPQVMLARRETSGKIRFVEVDDRTNPVGSYPKLAIQTPGEELKHYLPQLSSEKAGERLRAIKVLGRMGADAAPAVPELIKVFQNEKDMAIANEAAEALGSIGDPTAIPVMVDRLKTPPDKGAPRAGILAGLAKYGQKAAHVVPDLISINATKFQGVGNTIKHFGLNKTVAALGPHCDEPIIQKMVAMLRDDDRYVRDGAVLALSHTKPKDPMSIAEPLFQASQDKWVADEAKWALAELAKENPQMMKLIRDKMSNGSDQDRAIAFEILGDDLWSRYAQGNLPPEIASTIPEIAEHNAVPALSNSNPQVRAAALDLLRQAARHYPENTSIVDPIKTSLSDGEPNVKAAAARALQYASPDLVQDAIPKLRLMLKSKNGDVAEAAASSLVSASQNEQEYSATVSDLLAMSHSTDHNLRADAAENLFGMLNEENLAGKAGAADRILPRLLELTKDPVDSVRADTSRSFAYYYDQSENPAFNNVDAVVAGMSHALLKWDSLDMRRNSLEALLAVGARYPEKRPAIIQAVSKVRSASRATSESDLILEHGTLDTLMNFARNDTSVRKDVRSFFHSIAQDKSSQLQTHAIILERELAEMDSHRTKGK